MVKSSKAAVAERFTPRWFVVVVVLVVVVAVVAETAAGVVALVGGPVMFVGAGEWLGTELRLVIGARTEGGPLALITLFGVDAVHSFVLSLFADGFEC